MVEAGKGKGKGERERGWGGGSHNSLPPLCYALSVMLSFYGFRNIVNYVVV
jgi:hypothetical protein